jgi:hypothetical protein
MCAGNEHTPPAAGAVGRCRQLHEDYLYSYRPRSRAGQKPAPPAADARKRLTRIGLPKRANRDIPGAAPIQPASTSGLKARAVAGNAAWRKGDDRLSPVPTFGRPATPREGPIHGPWRRSTASHRMAAAAHCGLPFADYRLAIPAIRPVAMPVAPFALPSECRPL